MSQATATRRQRRLVVGSVALAVVSLGLVVFALASRSQAQSARTQAELARAMALRQADMDRIQQKLDRMHVVLDRAQMSKLRILERTRFKLASATHRRIVVCPQTGTQVTVDAEPDVADLDIDIADAQ